MQHRVTLTTILIIFTNYLIITPEINLSLTPDTVVCGPSGIALEAIPDFVDTYTYSWIGANLSNANVANPIANPTQPTVYFVTITDAIGCSDDASIFVQQYPQLYLDAVKRLQEMGVATQ